MLESPAFRVLSLSAHRVLARIEIELATHGGKENGKLPVTYDDFEKYGIHRHAISSAIREAVALGFIELTVHGCAGNAEHRAPNIFRLTYRPSTGRQGDGTHEWRRIKTIEEAEPIAKLARASEGRERRVRKYFPVAENAKSQWRKPPPKTKIPSGGNHHYGHSAETTTTIDISGREHVSQGKDTQPPADAKCVWCQPDPASAARSRGTRSGGRLAHGR